MQPAASALFDIPFSRLREILVSLGEPSFRASQLYRAVLHHDARSAANVTTLPVSSRAIIDSAFSFRAGRVLQESMAADGVTKQLVEFTSSRERAGEGASLGLGLKESPVASAAPRIVESVRIPEGRRSTLCVSSQAGCSLACSFCHTGTQKLLGNLSSSEIIEQVLLSGPTRPTNVVFMGMGEPLLNYRNVHRAVSVLTSKDGFAMPARRILISTAGISPIIPQLAVDLPGVRLALSLHAPTDELRTQLMGVNARFPLKETLAACAKFVDVSLATLGGSVSARDDGSDDEDDEGTPRGQFFSGTRRVRVSFEYVLLHAVNDAPSDAAALAQLLHGWHPRARLHALVNLIPFNAWPDAPFAAPHRSDITAFAETLRAAGFRVTVRRARGSDVLGACGQLKASAQKRVPARASA
jgi:23S rRNA (adenine2503-C2)-methyltransferase